MKELFKFSDDFQCLTGLYFSAEVILYILLAPIWGLSSISFALIWQMLLISVIITIIHYVFYVWDLFESLYKLKKAISYYIILVILGAIFTKLFNWFDLTNIKSLGIALGIFTITFLITYWSFDMYYKVTGEEYNEKLKLYKETKKN